MSNTQPIIIPQVPYAQRERPIKDATYTSYCSHWRKAKFQWEQTKHEYWKAQMERWGEKILRAGRPLPSDEKEKEVVVETQAKVEAAAPVDAALNSTLALLVKEQRPDVDITNPKAVEEAAREILKLRRESDPPLKLS